ncbi:MAG: hypothetical protein IJC04_01715 [Oscillospiraceae bacterium]|nr:hypothetical protein [Oscillospiraceae bacterium]
MRNEDIIPKRTKFGIAMLFLLLQFLAAISLGAFEAIVIIAMIAAYGATRHYLRKTYNLDGGTIFSIQFGATIYAVIAVVIYVIYFFGIYDQNASWEIIAVPFRAGVALVMSFGSWFVSLVAMVIAEHIRKNK